MRKHRFLNTLVLLTVVASLLLTCVASGLVVPRLAAATREARAAAAPAALPASPVDETKVPHYFGPNPNWANSPFTLPDATVTITGDGTGATAEATIGANGTITGIKITNPGTGYTTASVGIAGAGTGAAADAVVTLSGILTAINLTAQGSGYTAPVVNLSGGGATTQGSATAYGGVDQVILDTVNQNYSGYTMPTVDFDFPDDPNGTMPKAHVICAETNCLPVAPATTVTVVGVVVDQPGSGYAAAPGVMIRDGTLGNPINNRVSSVGLAARAQGELSESDGAVGGSNPNVAPFTPASATLILQYVMVDAFGSGYTSAPTVAITDPTGSGNGAQAEAVVDAGGVTGVNLTSGGSGYITPGGIQKFVDGLPGLCNPAVAGSCPAFLTDAGGAPLPTEQQPKYIPLGVPELKTYNGVEANEFVIGLVQYRTSFSSSLKDPNTGLAVGSLVRGYVQLETADNADISQHFPLYNEMLDGTQVRVKVNGQDAFGVTPPQWLGPTILTDKNKPVRIVFHNLLPTGAPGDLFLPVDTSLMGSGMAGGWENFDPVPVPNGTVMDDVRNPPCTQALAGTAVGPNGPVNCFTKNRATLHLHGGNTPWISDGTPHQWISPAGEATAYPQGVSVGNVPDMNVCTAGDDGCQTFYYTNQQSARLMFYHDHAYGLTRLNVYAGEAAGYVITDETETNLMAAGGALEGLGLGTPLVIQDRTFVPQPDQLSWQDPTWDYARWGGYGNLWYHHVYMPAQNPGDPGGMSGFGRWMYGPWFWPPAGDAKFGPIANPYFGLDPEGPDNVRGNGDDWTVPLRHKVTGETVACNFDDPNTWQYTEDPFCEPQLIPGTPNISAGMEQFNDTPVVNGTAYPTLTVEPKAYRFRMLNAANDRFFNFQWYVGDPSTASADTNLAGQVIGPTEVALDETLVEQAQTDPVVFPIPDETPTLPGGAADASYSLPGPDWMVIGSEGGFLPAPVLRDGQQETTWVTDPTVFHVGTVDLFSLLLAPAERADVVVDFSQFACQTLILYNDAPAAFPARIASYDYYTDAPDLRPVGAPKILPGWGPNTRTVMQVKVGSVNGSPCDPATPPVLGTAYSFSKLQNAFKHKADGSGVFESGQHPIIVGQAPYNSAYGTSFVSGGWCNAPTNPTALCDGYLRISEQGGDTVKFNTINKDMWGNPKEVSLKIEPKAIHDETNSSAFDEFGRMQANLGLEVVPATPMLQNIVLHPYTFPATELVDTSRLPKATTLSGGVYNDLTITPITNGGDGSQIWKVTHNGVDTHPIHFHAFDVQLLNRVTWDNIVMPPDATELGWKETVRISPLMDTIVALRAVVPTLPWDVPNAIRLLNPSMQDGTSIILSSVQDGLGLGLTAFAPNGEPIDVWNHYVNFGGEYVYHCHILSHEEMDMMRPVSLAYPPWAPTSLSLTSNPNGSVTLTWTDNSRSETHWVVQRSMSATAPEGEWLDLARIETAPLGPTTGQSVGGTVTYTDPLVGDPGGYSYRVKAINVVGDTWNYADPALNTIVSGGFPSITTQSAPTNVVTRPAPGPVTPSWITAVYQSRPRPGVIRIGISFENVPGETGYTLQRATNAAFTQGVNNMTVAANNNPTVPAVTLTQDVPRGTPGVTRYYYRVRSLNGAQTSGWSPVVSVVSQ